MFLLVKRLTTPYDPKHYSPDPVGCELDMSDLLRLVLCTTLLTTSVCALAQTTTAQPTQAAAQTTPQNTGATASQNNTEKPADKGAEKPAFIIDTLSTPLRSGPGNEYRTLSTVRAGENVTHIGQNPANGFIKIRDDVGNEGWLSGEYITYVASPKSSLESLKQQLSQQEMIAAQFEQERVALQAAVTSAESARDTAVQEAELAKQTAIALTKQLSEQNPPLAQNKMVIGGAVLAAGLLLGLILPALIPSRRRKDRWM